MNVTVDQLVVGDVIRLPGWEKQGTFLGRSEHPIYSTLRAVTWLMDDGTCFIDALSGAQEVGTLVDRVDPRTLSERVTNV